MYFLYNMQHTAPLLFVVLSSLLVGLPGGLSTLIRGGSTENFATSCLGGSDFSIAYEGTCSYDGVTEALQARLDQLENACTHDAATEIQYLSGITEVEAIKKVIAQSCKQTVEYLPFENVFAEGKQFDVEYFNGNTWLNNNRKVKDADGVYVNDLESNGHRIKEIYETKAHSSGIEWPYYVPNFEECKLRAAMCCFVQDRQADDNNGDCATPYDVGCADANPVDNTDICYVDMSKAPQSSRVAHGFAIFENGGEDFSHCHGIAWGDDPSDAGARYKANGLFYMSLYDSLYKSGYTSNVPGSPMCSCVEHMPVVTRSDCTEIAANESVEIKFSASTGELVVGIVSVDIDFHACHGENNVDDDLSAYYKRLVHEGKASQHEKDILDTMLVGDCQEAIEDFLASQWFAPKAGITITNFESRMRIYAEKNKILAEGVGARLSTYSDSYWEIKQVSCGDMSHVGEECLYIQNAESKRRLYAEVNQDGENGVGATYDESIHEDQKWMFKMEDCDGEECYLIVNAHSGRRLYASSASDSGMRPGFGGDSGSSWGETFGAVNPSDPIEDNQKWFF
uniref:Ricin B lectin domain-containing protein n=1 Tax=Fibrocapsa japonica TaxID=94617 RepID=A0A7S2V6L9_9STRA|mmetsp:Transcript_9753/g.14975  ORF Transcript_9753/g.14975 Transcript_9753/m.14975 type:complete len:567 (+) Transcript_9753:128-1828(+)